MFLYIFCGLLMVVSSHGDYRSDSGFQPSVQYAEVEDQLAEPSARNVRASNSKPYIDNTLNNDGSKLDRVQRFGITGYGNQDGSGYGGAGPAVYKPIQLDLGGVLLGTLLGFSAVLVIPKLVNALTYSYGGGGGFARSADLGSGQMVELMATLDDTLSRYNVDSASCMQRIACTYIQLANINVQNGTASDFDNFLASMAENSIVERFLGGTPVMDAIQVAKSDTNVDCQEKYPKCKLDKNTIVKIISRVLPV